MTFFAALVGIATFGIIAYRYLTTESRLPELLEQSRSHYAARVPRYVPQRMYRES